VTGPDLGSVMLAAALLALERICYVAAWQSPDAFRDWCATWIRPGNGDPVRALATLFVFFKGVQVVVFVGWCIAMGDGQLRAPDVTLLSTAGGLGLMAFGQFLNASVFARLGSDGVFYGNRFGRHIDWLEGFPFSWFRHPQYLGAVATIWGFFLFMRYPAPDWIILPLLETVYYALGAHLEETEPAGYEA
jgi:methylene-fatty-acyl-phospholipid synthase